MRPWKTMSGGTSRDTRLFQVMSGGLVLVWVGFWLSVAFASSPAGLVPALFCLILSAFGLIVTLTSLVAFQPGNSDDCQNHWLMPGDRNHRLDPPGPFRLHLRRSHVR